jgi:5-methylcytosine-specific restriction endonuclease McrA
MKDLSKLSNDEVTKSLGELVQQERECLAEVINHLVEIDDRMIPEEKACGNVYEYCSKILGYSERESYFRWQAQRYASQYRSILPMLASGKLTLTNLLKIGPLLTPESYRGLLARVSGKSKLEVEKLIAEMRPKGEPAEVIRHLDPAPSSTAQQDLLFLTSETAHPTPPPSGTQPPAPAQNNPAARSGPPSVVEFLTPSRVRFAFTGTTEFLDRFRKVQQLMWHKHPSGKLEAIVSELVEYYLKRCDPDRQKKKRRPKAGHPSGRKIPQWVKDIVRQRDGGQCVYVSPEGARCEGKSGLEYDHIKPYSMGGASNDPANIRLLCWPHNQMYARTLFPDMVPPKIRVKTSSDESTPSSSWDTAP